MISISTPFSYLSAGIIASTPTVMNVILDALAPLGITDVTMPATPERIWRAMHEHAGR